ncbi:MAG: hypothetical protein RKO25_09295 [Candidatus Contendobacter sp.]|nr:hypothetical protein [Candidatus Contendobacter sp.]
MHHDHETLLKRFYQSLKDQPLDPTDPYYIPYLEEDPREDPIAHLRTRIDWSEAASVNLLSGQRGSGKSTGLRRLKKYLEKDGHIVFLCDMRDYLNLTTPVEISDFFMAVMGGLSDEIEKLYRVNPGGRGFWERMADFVKKEVKIEEFSVGAEGVELKASLKDDPTFKQKLQSYLRGHVARLVKEAHQFGVEAVDLVHKKYGDPDRKVVLLLDSIEQIRGVGAEAKTVYDSVENLFSVHADSLRLDLLHVVYTIPPYLIPLAPGLGRYLGGAVVENLPSVHVFNQDGSEDPRGLKILKDIVGKRCPEWERIFSEAQLRRMACATGGDLRDFFRLIKAVLIDASMPDEGALPVADRLIEDAKNKLQREMLPIAEDDKVWLRKINASKEAELQNVQFLSRLANFFDTHLVLNYRNGQDWYDVHPLIRDSLD